MTKLLTTLALAVIAVSSFGQSFKGLTLTRPHAPAQNSFSALSGSYTVNQDTSLVHAVVFFDGLNNGIGAASYDLAQVNGLFNRPINLGLAAAQQNGSTYWSGPSASYNFIQSKNFTFGGIIGAPGLMFNHGTISMAKKADLKVGFQISFKLNS